MYAGMVITSDMLDFSRLNFNKAVHINARKKFEILSKYEKKKLSTVCDINTSKKAVSETPEDTMVSFVEMASVSNEGYITNKVNRAIGELRKGSYTYFKEGDIIIAKITPCMENGKCAIAEGLTNEIGFGSSEFHTFTCKPDILTKYLFLLLNLNGIRKAAEEAMTGASGHRRVPKEFYEELMIPVPPIPIQRKIIDACGKVEAQYKSTRMSIEEYREKIEALLKDLGVISIRPKNA